MTPRQRFLAALSGVLPDRLPVTTHHVMPSYLERYFGEADEMAFFERFGLDPIRWIQAHAPDMARGEHADPDFTPGHLEPGRIISDCWRIDSVPVTDPAYATIRFTIKTPGGNLTMVTQSDGRTAWVSERVIKKRADIDIIADHAPRPLCDVAAVNALADRADDAALIRGMFPSFDIYGQPGCWQDAAVLVGIEELIMATFDDPGWVHALLGILRDRKLHYAESLRGARFDLIELGGGDASSTVISPSIFEEFVAPYDAPLIDAAHRNGQRIVYHTCGGMMPLLETIAAMRPDAMETFTPSAMGGDADLAEAKRRIGDTVCMIGGFDQFHFFVGCTEAETRAEVRRCFREAGEGGRYILAPSDHFFDADPVLLAAFVDEARQCVYGV
jgi:uroporphyrinogen decarboxylase